MNRDQSFEMIEAELRRAWQAMKEGDPPFALFVDVVRDEIHHGDTWGDIVHSGEKAGCDNAFCITGMCKTKDHATYVAKCFEAFIEKTIDGLGSRIIKSASNHSLN